MRPLAGVWAAGGAGAGLGQEGPGALAYVAKPPSIPLPSSAEAEAQASSAALLSQEATRGAQVVATLGGPDSLLGQAREARRWTERLLRGTGQPGGTAVWEPELKGLVDKVQRLHPQLLRLLVTAGVVGGDGGHWGFAKARPLP